MPGPQCPSVRHPWLLATAVLCVATAASLAAQDVEMAGRAHGVKAPNSYYTKKAKDPHAFEFRRAWLNVAQEVRRERAEAAAHMDLNRLNGGFPGGRAVPAAAIAERLAVAGTRKVPVLLGMFSNSDSSAVVAIGDSVAYRTKLFGTDPAPPYSVTTYYDEISNGLLTLSGATFGWFRANSPDTFYEGSSGCNGLDEGCGGHTGDYLQEILGKADGQVDFSQFDNDGPDGIANSGDDDGYVDFVAFVMPEVGGECGTTNLWAHRYVLEGWSPGVGFTTNDPAAGGGNILVSDYIIQSGLGGNTGCTSGQIMPIGTMSHESGHAFGLPDLYDTFGISEGTGEWSLMGSGSWLVQSAPAHMDGWSKFTLGWIAVDTMTGGASPRPYVLNHIVHPASLIPDTALALCTNAAACFDTEYLLLENRQAIGSDVSVHGGGGLVAWHVDPAAIAARLFFNTVNAETPHGLAMLEADGLNELDAPFGDRGDAGDPFPGSTGNHALGLTTNPSTALNSGFPSGIVIENITENPDSTIGFEVHYEAVPDPPTQIALITPPSGAVSGQLLTQLPVVEMRDANDQPVLVPGIPVTVQIATGPGSIWAIRGKDGKLHRPGGKNGKLDGPQKTFGVGTTQTDANGQATFSDLVIIGAGDYTVTFAVNGIPPVTSPTFTVTQPASTVLASGQAVTSSDPAGRAKYYSITVPAGNSTLIVTITGGTGDADLYVREGLVPLRNGGQWDCRPFLVGNEERCVASDPAPGTFEIMLVAFEDYTDVSLTATYSNFTQLAVITQAGGGVSGTVLTQQPVIEIRNAGGLPVLQQGVVVTAVRASGPGVLHGSSSAHGKSTRGTGKQPWSGPQLAFGAVNATTDAAGRATFTSLSLIDAGNYTLGFSAGSATAVSQSFTVTQPASTPLVNGQAVNLTALEGSARYYSLTVPAGADSLVVTITGGTGDADLYLAHGSPPTVQINDCSPFLIGNEEECGIDAPAGGAWYVMVIGFEDYADVELTARYPGVAYALDITGAGTGSGTVTAPGAGIDCTLSAGAATGACTGPVLAATPVTLTATASSTSLFTLWTGAGACDHVAACAVTPSGATGVTARFVLAPSQTVGAGPLLSGPALDAESATALDQLGNKNGSYDIGDYLALIDHLTTPVRFATVPPPPLRPASRAPQTPTKGDRP